MSRDSGDDRKGSKDSGDDSGDGKDKGNPPAVGADEIVREFLHGQNLEQVGKLEEAIALYERAVDAHFDAAGPYDRLIFAYQQRKSFREVVRVGEAALSSVHTYEAKRDWYRRQISEAKSSMGGTPQPLPR
ncbi:MAG: hypothetical protein ACRDJU_11085 [Actinomycetota bacterium]